MLKTIVTLPKFFIHPAFYKTDTKLFPYVKGPGHGLNQPPLTIAEVKERVELTCAPPLCLVAGYRVSLTFTLDHSPLGQEMRQLYPFLPVFESSRAPPLQFNAGNRYSMK
jgi:hypothetical protein